MKTKNLFWKKQISLITALFVSAFFFGNSTGLAALSSSNNSGGKSTIDVEPVGAKQVQAQEMLLSQPLSFIPNQGQAPGQIKYYAVSGKRSFHLTKEGLVLRLPEAGSSGRLNTLALKPVGLNPRAELVAVNPLPGRVNYFKGQAPKEWRTNLPTYGAVLYREAYPGIDLKVYGSGRQIEYDIIVKPGADPAKVRFRAAGVQGLSVNDQGDLLLSLPGGETITQKKPVVYQEIDGRRVLREGRFQVAGGQTGSYGFKLGPYDARYPLIIDPLVVVYANILGGSSDDLAWGIAVDSSGNAYVTGYTYSDAPGFPITPGAYQLARGGVQDAFIIKLGPNGALLAATFLGGGSYDVAHGIAVDASGNVYVAGTTESGNFPTTVNAYRRTKIGDTDVFVAKLDNSLSSLLYSTYLGGGSGYYWYEEFGRAIAVNSSGGAYVTGYTQNADFPTKRAFQATTGGSGDVFVARIDTNLAGEDSLVYSSFLGGNSDDDGHTIAVDSSGNAYVAGSTRSVNFPLQNPLPGIPNPIGERTTAFVTKITFDGSLASKEYCTYLGGSTYDVANGIAVDGAGAAYVVGVTGSADFPLVNPIQGTLKGSADAFITKLALSGSSLTLGYSTYLGGSEGEEGDTASAVAVDESGAVYVLVAVNLKDFPIINPIPGYFGYEFVTKINPGGTAWVYSTPLWGNWNDGFKCLAVDGAGQVYAAGRRGPNPTDILVLKFKMVSRSLPGVFLLLN